MQRSHTAFAFDYAHTHLSTFSAVPAPIRMGAVADACACLRYAAFSICAYVPLYISDSLS